MTAYNLRKNEKNIGHRIKVLLAYSYVLNARDDKTGAISKLIELQETLKQFSPGEYWRFGQIYISATFLDLGIVNAINRYFNYDFTR